MGSKRFESKINRDISHLLSEHEVMEEGKVKDYDGNEYSSIREMCSRYKIRPETFLYRYKAGWPMRVCLCADINTFNLRAKPFAELAASRKMCKKSTSNAVKHRLDEVASSYNTTVEDILSKNKIQMYNVYSRLRNGYTEEEALGLVGKFSPDGKKKIEEERKHKIDKEKRDAEKASVIKTTLANKIYSAVVARNQIKITVEGTIADMCKKYGVTENDYRARLAKGWTLDEIFYYPSGWNDMCIDPFKIKYKTVDQMAKLYQLDPVALKYKLSIGVKETPDKIFWLDGTMLMRREGTIWNGVRIEKIEKKQDGTWSIQINHGGVKAVLKSGRELAAICLRAAFEA